jgi:arylsulfatase A
VLFMSDNGGLTCVPGGGKNGGEHITSNAPLRGGKAMMWEGGIREPMFARWPGVIEENSQCSVPVITDDFFPTFLEIAGSSPGPDDVLDGETLMPLLTQTGELKRDHICFHFPHYIVGHQPDHSVNTWWNTPSSAIRKGDYKLLRFHEGWSELYDLKKDIGETTNLADQMPRKVVELQADLDKFLKDTGAWMPLPNPRYDPKALIKKPKKK